MTLRIPHVRDRERAKRVVLKIVLQESGLDETPWARTIEFGVVDE